MALDANLSGQMSKLARCPETRNEIVTQFVRRERDVRGETFRAAGTLAAHRERAVAVAAHRLVTTEHDQLFAREKVGKLNGMDLGQLHRCIIQLQIGEDRVLNLCRQHAHGLFHVFGGFDVFGRTAAGG